jgi:hypothetical protein
MMSEKVDFPFIILHFSFVIVGIRASPGKSDELRMKNEK